MTFTVFSGTWNRRIDLKVPDFEPLAAREYSATGHPDPAVHPL